MGARITSQNHLGAIPHRGMSEERSQDDAKDQLHKSWIKWLSIDQGYIQVSKSFQLYAWEGNGYQD
jgi:hypothetical protein